MENNALTLFGRQENRIEILPEAEELREEMLVLANRCHKVATGDDQEKAVEIQTKLKEYLDTVEVARKTAKAPAWAECVRIDELASALMEEVKTELMRVSRLVGDYRAAEEVRLRAAEALRLKDLEEIERQKQASLATAQTVDEANRIQESYNRQAEAMPVQRLELLPGQTLKDDWDIQMIGNGLMLANSHPQCVDITPRKREIKALLNAGVKVQGITAIPIKVAGVGRPKKVNPIEV